MAREMQLDGQGALLHFLSIEGLGQATLEDILEYTEAFAGVGKKPIKKAPLLRGKTVVNLFFEPSTRTRMTFELAAKRLAADILDLNIATSSASKGETLSDTLQTLSAMHCDMVIVRHALSGAAHYIASQAGTHISVINAGDGRHAHPTQAIIDMFTIRRHWPDFTTLKVALVGDILHSRVARSDIHALNILNALEVRIIAPHTLIPKGVEGLGVQVYHDIEAGLSGVHVIIMLRLQRERMQGALLPSENEYFQRYGLTEKRLALADPGAIVMHPGPINRGIEIDSNVADGRQSVILQQVRYAIAARMAIMAMIAGAKARGHDED